MVVITGKALIKLLLAEGYLEKRYTRHGLMLQKHADGRTRTTVVKDSKEEVPPVTLKAILGPQQTGLGIDWLRKQLGQG